MGAVIDRAAAVRLQAAFDRANALDTHELLVGGQTDTSVGWFVDPTIYTTDRPDGVHPVGGVLRSAAQRVRVRGQRVGHRPPRGRPSQRVRPDLSIFASDRRAISSALDALRNAAGMTYINDKPTGALMGQVSFGGGRASGTNDRTGSRLALQRWISPRFIKETLTAATDWTYPYLQR